MTGTGINTVRINGEIKHITELDAITLSNEWSKLKNENADLYRYNHQVSQGWRGLVLRLIGVHLPDKCRCLQSETVMLAIRDGFCSQ
ncbi:hypothetical protein D0123_22405 [Salmonella enterica]|uniref:Uncharacterized protein n=1 Tax=Salmonella enterica TaxID=28901 RepID=A0A5T6HBW9_SALER|nr:hypothetical protein [Salmonella enterica]